MIESKRSPSKRPDKTLAGTLIIAALTVVGAWPSAAHAQRGRRPPPPRTTTPVQPEPQSNPTPSATGDEAPQDAPSFGADADTLVQAIQAAALAGTPEGAQSIARLIANGVPPRAAAAGLDALGVLSRPEGASAILRFMQHRRVTLRRHAIAAAQAIHTPELLSALAGKLSDSDERVRLDAATALGEVGSAQEVAQSFAAFERDVDAPHGAEGSPFAHQLAKHIGRVGSQEQVTQLLGFLRRASFVTMNEALSLAVRRSDIPERLRLRIVTDVGNLATGGVRAFLTAIADNPRECGPTVSRAARAAADRITASE